MGCFTKFLIYLCYTIFFLPVFVILLVLAVIKVAIFSPFVFLIIAFGDVGIVIGLWPVHLVWSIHCIRRTRKFGGPILKCLVIVLLPVPIALWTVIGVVGSVIMGIVYAFVWPFMKTFEAISKNGVPFYMRIIKCVTDGSYHNVWGACTIVRDFADFSFHSYFSVMDELLGSKEENETFEIKDAQLLGCIFAAISGVVINVPLITLIVLYKAPIMLYKGWQRLIHDLIGREGPFLESVCVPFAGLWILLWPIAVLLAMFAGIMSSLGFSFHAAIVAFKESSTKRGFLFVISTASLFDEYTNDLLYLREGSCFPRFRYGENNNSSSSLVPLKGLHGNLPRTEPLIRTLSGGKTTPKAAVIRDSFIKACEEVGIELFRAEAITVQDLEKWKNSKSKIFHIGLPSYAFLECFFESIKSGSAGFIMRDNAEISSVNRPEGRIFDWLFDPMCIMKEQIRNLSLNEAEELYFYKHCLYSGDAERIESWQNGGIPPHDEIKRAQLEGISRRLQGFCLTLSRLPTARRHLLKVVKTIDTEVKNYIVSSVNSDIEAAI